MFAVKRVTFLKIVFNSINNEISTHTKKEVILKLGVIAGFR